ncbi:MAG: pyruvate dehydrogenase complex dihydrolipoamide acetyltransferase [Sandaracinus sp.]
MAKIVGLPKLSPTMEEGTLARWAKEEGDEIGIDDLVAEIETDKATMEWRSFDKAVLLKILVPEGSTLKPDQPVAIFGQKGEDVSALVAQAAGGGAGPVAVAAAPAKTPEPTKESAPVAAAPVAEAPVSGGRVAASPLVRKIARERSIDLARVRGTGPHGRIVKRDVEGLAATSPAPASVSAPVAITTRALGERRPPTTVKLSQMRKTIARRLTESKQNVPHFYLTIDVDAGPLVAARAQINAELEAQFKASPAPGQKSAEKVSVNDLLIKACAAALRRVPAVNSSFTPEALVHHDVVDISVAVAVPDGLLTPVVRDADQLGVLAIARAVRDLAGRAKDKKLKPEEMTGGTFSISNLGMFGIEQFAAVINPPEGAILAVGTVREEPVVKNGAVVPGQRLRMTLSCDHRVVDGAVGAEFLAVLKRIVEAPITLLV